MEAARQNWLKANRGRKRQAGREWALSNPDRTALHYTRAGAKRRGLAWLLDDEVALALIRGVCFYCGSAPEPANGIDRVDNSKGYENGNVVGCCAQCNFAKNDLSVASFLAWVSGLAAQFPIWNGVLKARGE